MTRMGGGNGQRSYAHWLIAESELAPTGLGEPTFPPVFAAVANALYKATGKRHYNQPFIKG